jgi:hypothetical protein
MKTEKSISYIFNTDLKTNKIEGEGEVRKPIRDMNCPLLFLFKNRFGSL